jgi:methylaspartate mutase epsilon subunit
MSDAVQAEGIRPPFSAARIDDDVFAAMRRENLARWPTGAEVDIDEAVAYHQAMPAHKNLSAAMRKADAEGRCLTQPRGGFGTLELQLELMRQLDQDGMADVDPATTDSYTRNEQWERHGPASRNRRRPGGRC